MEASKMNMVIAGVIILFIVIVGLTIWVTNKAYSRKND